MDNKEENIEPVKGSIKDTRLEKSLLSKIINNLFKLFIVLFLFLMVLLVFIQTDYFDKLALDFALDKINTSLEKKDSRISAESLKGNIFKGFTLNNGSVRVKNDTLLKFNSIQAEYNVFKLIYNSDQSWFSAVSNLLTLNLNKEISVQKLVLREPQINLTNVRDEYDSLKLNLDYLLASDEPDTDTSSSPFDWGITAEDLSIENGAIRILKDKNSDLPIRDIVMQNLDTFNFSYTDLTNLNLNLSAKFFPEEKDVDIKNISFNTNSDFNVNKLTLSANIDQENNVTNVRSLYLNTYRSDLRINQLLMNGFQPFDAEDYEDFHDNNTTLDIETQNFNIKDLTYFLTDLNFLDSTVSFKMKAEGNYGELNISKLDLYLPNSAFQFSGKVKNLHNPSKISFDITGKDIEIDPKDTKNNLPGLPIPDYSRLGIVRVPYVTYIGEPENFKSDFDIRTAAGNALGNIAFDLREDVIKYKGDFSTTNINLGEIVNEKELESNITGEFKVDAAGFDYKTARGRLNYKINRTKFLKQNIASSEGQLEFNRGNVNLDVTYNSDAVKTKLAGKINVSNLDNIVYDLKGTVSGLNIASFTNDNSQSSDLNFDFDINGRGFDPNSMSGVYKIDLKNSSYADLNFPETPIDLNIDQNGNIKKIGLKTEFAEVDIDGSLNFSVLGNVISNNIQKVKGELTKSLELDSVINSISENYSYSAICEDLNFDYKINVINSDLINSFAGIDSLLFKGSFEGNLSDSCGIFNLTSKGFVNLLWFKDSLLIVKDAPLNVNIKNDINRNELSGLDAKVTFSADKMIVSKFPLDTTLLRVGYSDNKNNFFIWSKKDSTASVYTEGSLLDSLIIRFDTLNAKYGPVNLTNNSDLLVQYVSIDSSQSINFRKFNVNSLNQKLSVEGIYSLTDSSNIKLSASNVNLSTIQKYLSPDKDTTDMVNGKIRYIDLSFKGISEYPLIQLTAISENLSLGSTRIGRLDADVKIEDDNLISNISFYNRNNTGSFSLKGNLPIILNFSDNKTDSASRYQRFLAKKVDLNAIADNFQLKVLQQLLPYTENLEAILKGKISLLGTAEKPILTGKMDLDSGKMYVTMNKMNYNFFANVSTNDEKLIVTGSRIFAPSDITRFISTTGYIDFTGLKLNDINLVMLGDMKAFDKDNGPTELGISGDLWVGSGRNKLNLRGNSDRFDLTGDLLLVKGNVVFNPFGKEAYNIYSDDFNYGLLIDSLKSDGTSIEKVIKGNSDSTIVLKNELLNPFEKIKYLMENKNEIVWESTKKGGKFFYDVTVVTSGNVFLKFIVNEKSQQEFFGEIRTGDLNVFNTVDYTMMGRGTVTLGDNCYYKFFRKFDATGSTTFTGNITNPRLDINAQYKGYASSGTDAQGQQVLDDVIIDLKVTGEASSPDLNISLQKNGNKETGSNATSDAIAFLLFGKFADQLSFGESTSFGASIGASYLSNIVSNELEDLFPFLINTSLNYTENEQGGFADNTDVRFTAAIGDAVVRFGGQIFKGLANTDIIVDYPINKLLKMNSVSNNLIFRFERVYDPFYNDADITNTNGTRIGALVYYIIKF
ncbi:MAG: hypothetical protein KBF96_01095 [Ignavibacteria bacterium]|nr:hypothetical protein [Ignavibacteria bacterium]